MFWKLCVIALYIFVGASYSHTPMEDQQYWRDMANLDLMAALKVRPNTKTAKNVIIFIGDGMGLSTVTAARIFGKSEKEYLSFEKAPHIGVLKTYSANKIVPDSCSTATALFSGVKANQRTGGLDATVEQNDCIRSLLPQARVNSIFTWAQRAGKFTGFVTTTRVTHATPAALYAHTASRYWECDANMPRNASQCKDIARQLIEDEPGRNINVIMGGGMQMLQSNVTNSTTDPIDTWACYSKDGRNLVDVWVKDKSLRNRTYVTLTTNREINNLRPAEFTLGIFAKGHMKMEHERDTGPKGSPSLTMMAEAAIRQLERHPDGYVLMVEGGLIDFSHHRGKAKKALSETVEFHRAIEAVVAQVNLDETLVVVTSDHSHPLVIAGYADRATKITGIAQESKTDGVPYTSLLYAAGGENNYKYQVVNGTVVERENPTLVDTDAYEYSQQAGVKTAEVPHDGTDVLVYAEGPWAHLFHSVHEQTYVAYVMAYAARIGPYLYRPEQPNPGIGNPFKEGAPPVQTNSTTSSSDGKTLEISMYLLISLLVIAACGRQPMI